MNHKRQHYIPESYLKAWCDPKTPAGQKPYVWQISTRDRTSRRKAPSNIFYERDFYTIKGSNGERDLILEHGLSQLEGRFASLRRHRLERHLNLSYDDRLALCAFMAAMQGRTPKFREHMRNFAQEALDKMDRMNDRFASATPEEREDMVSAQMPISENLQGGPSATYEDVKQMAEYPTQTWLPVDIEVHTPILMALNIAVLQTRDETGFITSDSPCVWFDADVYRLPVWQRAVGLANPGIEITLPISPRQLILMSWQEPRGYIDINNMHMNTPGRPLLLDELNRRTCLSSGESIVVCRNRQSAYWFTPVLPGMNELSDLGQDV